MDPLIVVMVLFAAFLHATWNIIVKRGEDRLLTLVIMSVFAALLATLALPLVELPGLAIWPYIVISAAVHNGYKVFLAQGYRHGDLSQVYPVARGTAPLIVAVLAFLFAGETLDSSQLLAVLLIALGIAGLALRNGLPAHGDARALFYALGTATLIACYTVIDGIGARLSDAVFGFVLYLIVTEGVLAALMIVVLRGVAVIDQARRRWRSGLAGGVMSATAYGLVVLALTRGDMALVSALRETSVLFAAVMGTAVLREPMGVWRLSCATVVVCGLLLLHV